MGTCKQLRDRSLGSLKGKWGTAILSIILSVLIFYAVYVIAFLICLGISLSVGDYSVMVGAYFLCIIFAILILPLSYGWYYIILKIARNGEPKVEYLFEGFHDYKRITLTFLLMQVYVYLWSLLFIVPGIVKSYSYAMTGYLLIDNPSLSYDAAIHQSSLMMKGKKWKLFLLDLSFIGWIFLSVITLEIGFIFLAPYWQTARAHFYEDLRADKEAESFG